MSTKNANMSGDSSNDLLSMKEAAQIEGLTWQSIYVAIRKKRLKATKDPKSGKWKVKRKDLEESRHKKYSRAEATFNGELIFDNSKGFYSIAQAAKMLGVNYHKIYHAMHLGLLIADRKGSSWVLHIDAIEDYKKNHL